MYISHLSVQSKAGLDYLEPLLLRPSFRLKHSAHAFCHIPRKFCALIMLRCSEDTLAFMCRRRCRVRKSRFPLKAHREAHVPLGTQSSLMAFQTSRHLAVLQRSQQRSHSKMGQTANGGVTMRYVNSTVDRCLLRCAYHNGCRHISRRLRWPYAFLRVLSVIGGSKKTCNQRGEASVRPLPEVS